MPYYPTLSEQQTTRLMTDTFYGYNHQQKIGDGEMYDEMNLSARNYPLLSTRKPRKKLQDLTNPQGIIAKEYLAYVDDGTLYYDGNATAVTGLSAGEKQLVSMGAYILIFPDKKYYNTSNANDYGDIEASYTSSNTVTFQLCTITGIGITPDYVQSTEPSNPQNGEYWIDTSGNIHGLYVYTEQLKQWSSVGTCYTKIIFSTRGQLPFSVNDGITISGAEYSGANPAVAEQIAEINGSKVIYGAGGSASEDDYIIVIGLLDEVVTQSTALVITREVPDMDYVCEANNRIWGCYYGTKNGVTLNEIYCCALGDFKNWNQFLGLSTDSYVASVGSDGKWTGAVNYLGYPSFFKEKSLHRVSVSSVGAHQITETPLRGVQDGSWKSLTVVNEILYYKGVTDVMAYQGSFPDSISKSLGDEKYSEAKGEAFGDVYYLSMKDSDNNRVLFTYDADKGLWHKEDDLNVVDFVKQSDTLYAMTNNELLEINPDDGTEIVQWYAETGMIGYEYPDNKYLSRFNVRFSMDPGSWINVYIEYDSSGNFILVGHITIAKTGSVTLPIRARRCDHMRLKLEGSGNAKIYSIAKVLEIGSDY